MYNREKTLKSLASLYFKFLNNIDWEDEVYVNTLNETTTNYLTYAFLTVFKSRGGFKKYRNVSNYITEDALEILRTKKKSEVSKYLRFEHMVPKNKYIQGPLERQAKDGRLTLEGVYEILNKYWYIATVTVEENNMLLPSEMPDDWDNLDHLSRYKEAGLNEKLMVNTIDLL